MDWLIGGFSDCLIDELSDSRNDGNFCRAMALNQSPAKRSDHYWSFYSWTVPKIISNRKKFYTQIWVQAELYQRSDWGGIEIIKYRSRSHSILNQINCGL